MQMLFLYSHGVGGMGRSTEELTQTMNASLSLHRSINYYYYKTIIIIAENETIKILHSTLKF